RPHPRLREAFVDLVLRLREMDVDQGFPLLRELPDAEERVLRDRVDRVGPEGRPDAMHLQVLDLAVRLLRRAELLRGTFRIVEVHDALRDEGPEPPVLY